MAINQSLSTQLFKNYFVMMAKECLERTREQMELYPHTAAAGDCLNSICHFEYQLKPAGDPEAETLEELLALFNLSALELRDANSDLDTKLTDGGTITVPVEVSPAAIVKANQGQTGILKDGVPVSIAGNTAHTIKSAEDSFGSLAAKYNISLDELAQTLATNTEVLKPGEVLTIPNIPVARLEQLKEQLLRNGAFNNTGAMASAYMLSGLRVPDPNDGASGSDTPDTYPLFSLTGQQFNTESGNELKLTNSGAKEWINFNGNAAADMTVPLSQTDIAALKEVSVKPENIRVDRLPLFTYLPERYGLSQKVEWSAQQGAETLRTELPCLKGVQNVAGGPDIRMFPQGLREKPARSADAAEEDKSKLFYEVVKTCYRDASAPNKTKDADAYCYGTAIDLFVRRIPAVGGGDMPDTYLMEGTDEKGMKLLYQLKTYLEEFEPDQSDPNTRMYLLYEADPNSAASSGFASDNIDTAKTILMKTNLSTLSHKDGESTGALSRGVSTSAFIAPFNERNKFITFLWQCTTVKTGGFYFNYIKNSAGDAGNGGLPAHVFEENGVGRLTLLVVVKEQNKEKNRELLHFNNCAVLGDNIDTSSTLLSIQPLTHQIKSADTLTTIRANDEYGTIQADITIVNLIKANRTIRNLLKPGAITISGTEYEIKYGDTLDTFRTDNPGLSDDALAGAALFQPGALLQFSNGALHQKSTVPQGNIGFQVEMDNPDYGTAIQNHHQYTFDGFVEAVKDVAGMYPAGTELTYTGATEPYTCTGTDTPQGIANQVLGKPSATSADILSIVNANPNTHLTTGKAIPYQGQTLTAGAGETLAAMGQRFKDFFKLQWEINTRFHLLGFKIKNQGNFNTSKEGLPLTPTVIEED